MSEFENMENELDPRLRQMLKAYGSAPERDPESARRNQERFVAILNAIFDEQTIPKPQMAWFGISAWLKTFAHSRRNRLILIVFFILVMLAAFLFGGVGITVYAASSSLPGDALYSLKTTMEEARVGLTADPAARARLYTEFAGRRLSEIQSLIHEGRYGDISQAANEFEREIQKVKSAIESLSQTDPARAVVLSAETAEILQGYTDILNQMLAGLPGDIQPVIQSAINASQSAIDLLDVDDDDFDDDDNGEIDDGNGRTPSPQPSNTPQLTGTQISSESSETQQVIISTSVPVATEPPPATPIPPATQDGGSPVIQGGDGICQGFLGAITVENVQVPQGASCTLDGTQVQGNILVENGASLTAQRVTVIGNIQAEGASLVEMLAGSTVGGSIQLKQGGSARVENVSVNGDIQFESNNGVLSATGNQVGGNVQVFQNGGGVTIADNAINGNLQCKENNPIPAGGNNVVQGNKEDQCAGL